jgi:hypothetical protein
MAFLAVLGGLMLCLAWGVREYQLWRERNALQQTIQQLRTTLDAGRQHARRVSEDLYVLQAVLVERNLLDEDELQRSRIRLVDTPRRLAEERNQLLRNMSISPTQLVDDGDPKVH